MACDFSLSPSPRGSACVQILESARSGLICRMLFVLWVMSPFMSHGGEWTGFIGLGFYDSCGPVGGINSDIPSQLMKNLLYARSAPLSLSVRSSLLC
jgi:hypothetical protein